MAQPAVTLRFDLFMLFSNMIFSITLFANFSLKNDFDH